MKVLLVHNYYRQRLIGGEDIVFRKELNSLKKVLGEGNVIEYSVSSDEMNFLSVLANVFTSVFHFIKIYQIIRKEKVQLMHCHNYFPLLSFSPFIAARISGVKSILTLHNYRLWCASGYLFRNGKICHLCIDKKTKIHGIVHRCYHNSYLYSTIITLASSIYRLQFKLVDFFFVLSPFQSQFLVDNGLLGQNKIILKPNFISSSIIETNSATKEFDLVFIGKLEEQKGILEIVDVFSKKLQKYKILIIGDGPLMSILKIKQVRNITIKGKVEPDQIQEYIRRSRFLIQPSLWYETFGLTIIEAFSVGVPVIGFPIGTRKDFIEEGITGFFVNLGSLDSDILNVLVTDNDHYKQLQENCIHKAKEYREDHVIAKQLQIYRQVTDFS